MGREDKRLREMKTDSKKAQRSSYQPETFPQIKRPQRGYASAENYPSTHLHQWINEQTDQALADRDASMRALEGRTQRQPKEQVTVSKAWLAYPHLREPGSSPRNSYQPGKPSTSEVHEPDHDNDRPETLSPPATVDPTASLYTGRTSRLKSFISKCTFNLLEIPVTANDRRRASFSQHANNAEVSQSRDQYTSSKRGVSLDIRPTERGRPSVIHHFSANNTPSSNTISLPPTNTDGYSPARKSFSSYGTDPTSFRGPVSSENYFGTKGESRKTVFRRSVWADSSTASNTTDSGMTDVSSADAPVKRLPVNTESSAGQGRKSVSSLLKPEVLVPQIITKQPTNLQKSNRPSPKTTKPSKPYAPPRLSFSALRGDKKKKKLVINGIGPEETQRAATMRKWCEDFGEVTYFGWMNNGDIQVIFARPEVADTVCRLRASVRIVGVGSVNLSWYIGEIKH